MTAANAANQVGGADLSALERELAELCVSALNLEQAADTIDPTAQLYGDGLGLDSIDILEVAMAVSKTYGFQLRSDDSDNVKIFCSERTSKGPSSLRIPSPPDTKR